MEIFATHLTAWIIVILSFLLGWASIRYVILHPTGKKKYLKGIGAIFSFYITVIYTLIAVEHIPIGPSAAGSARVAFILGLSLLLYNDILDWNTHE